MDGRMLLLCVSATVLYICSCTQINYDARIVNGIPISASQYPWMVSLRASIGIFKYQNEWIFQQHPFCGASLIGLQPPVILTAAHCLYNKDNYYVYNETDDTIRNLIYNGSELLRNFVVELHVDINRTDPELEEQNYASLQLSDLSEIHVHPLWNESALNPYDIALLIFTDYNESQFDLQIDPLPSIADQLAQNESCCAVDEWLTAIGYGRNTTEGQGTKTLEQTSLQYKPILYCVENIFRAAGVFDQLNFTEFEQEFKRNPDESLICVDANDTNICQGDSGGPLFRMNGEVAEIVGVTSTTIDGCDDRISPYSMATYTSVGHYREWIQQTIDEVVYGLESTTQEPVDVTTEQPMNISTTLDDEDSISGKWCKYDMHGNEVFGVSVSVNSDCTLIRFVMYSPANNTWFGFGIGGEYEHESSEELEAASGESMSSGSETVSESDVMNGYAIISAGSGVDDVYESMLESGVAPQPQTQNDLSCNSKVENGVRYVECTRSYDTQDTADDFNSFVVGVNPMIYAYGPIAADGSLVQHHANAAGYGEAHVSFIYMEQEHDLCGYAAEYAKQQAVTQPDSTDDTWMIVGIVFICLFAVTLGVAIFLAWKWKQSGSSSSGGYQPTSNADE